MDKIMLHFLAFILVSLTSSSEVSVENILSQHNICTEPFKKKFSGEVLAFLTPWNSKGYDYALKYSAKIDYISPCWYQLNVYTVYGYKLEYDLLGEGNKTFIEASKDLFKILPRIILENTNTDDYKKLLESDEDQVNLSEKIKNFIISKGFAGVMLEMWTQGNGILRNADQKEYLRSFQVRLIQKICRTMKANNLMCMITVPAPRPNYRVEFSMGEFLKLSKFVDRFALVSYDYSQISPGPNSPENWIKSCYKELVDQIDLSDYDEEAAESMHLKYMKQLMLGVPFYGYEFSPLDKPNQYTRHSTRAITGNDFLQLLEKNKMRVEWESAHNEHKFSYKIGKNEIIAYFPTKEMIESRVKLAEKLKTGISIWELGQGFEYFFEAL
ncbi:unnamed protein product [Blepharisma stoltei]|uniref:Chitinase domain-containing protein 1 n=1 Tax=Blepharisma stoltei TaxID=1481888 RepID=A0AAU9IPQ3_9CILI|nr:unnamed protein product [Blepharisma stoltei]